MFSMMGNSRRYDLMEETDIRRYVGVIGGTGYDKANWVKIGRITSSDDSMAAEITIHTGNGFNARADQNATIKIHIKNAWQASYSWTDAFGVSWWVEGEYDNRIKVDVRASAHNICDIYVYFPWGHWGGDYVVQLGHPDMGWTGAGGVETPAYGTAQTCTNITPDMRGWPVGSVMTMWDETKPYDKVGGSWSLVSGGRMLIGVGSSRDTDNQDYTIAASPRYSGALYPTRTSATESAGYGLTKTEGFKDRVVIARSSGATSISSLPPYTAVHFWLRTA